MGRSKHHTIGNEKPRRVDEGSLLISLTFSLHIFLSRLDPPNDVVGEILKRIRTDLHPTVVAVDKLVARKESFVDLLLAACSHSLVINWLLI
jgi:hypothetical protein